MMADYNPRPKKIKKTGDNLELRFTELGFQQFFIRAISDNVLRLL